MKNIQEPIWCQRKHKAREFDGNNKLPLSSIIIIINFPKQNTFMKKVNEPLIDHNLISILQL